MGVRGQAASRFSSEDDFPSISHMISTLRATFLSRDFDRAEENLVAREAKLKREIKELKDKNAKLEEQHQFDQLEMLKVADERNVANERYKKLLQEMKRGVGEDDNDAVMELMRKCSELEVEKRKLEVLLEREYSETERRLSRIEEKAEKWRNVRCRDAGHMEGTRDNGEMIFDGRKGNRSATSHPVKNLENVFEFNGNGSVAASAQDPSPSDHSHSKGNGDRKTSGAQKSPILVIDSDDDDDNEKPEPNDYLALASVEHTPKVLKRKRASSLSSSDNENGDDPMTLGQEEKKGAEEKSQFLRSPAEVGDDCNSDDSSSSTSTSSSSDSENGNRGPSFYAARQKVKATQERRYN